MTSNQAEMEFVFCIDCGSEGPSVYGSEQAISNWNERFDLCPDAATVRAEALREAAGVAVSRYNADSSTALDKRNCGLPDNHWAGGASASEHIEREILALIDTPAPVSPQEAAISGGVEAIAAERQRQIEVEGWVPEHDDHHGSGEIAGAAACYAMQGLDIGANRLGEQVRLLIRDLWPWDRDWWKPKNRRADLVRAGALIAAEIDRLDRLAEQEQTDG